VSGVSAGAPARLRQAVPLAPLTTLGVGGPAAWFLEARSDEEVAEGLAWARREGLPLFVLGGGSNLLVADGGFPGLVLQVATRGIRQEGAGERLVVAAGEPWDGVVELAVRERLQGIECLSGIPGSTGATPIQNVGAYGQEVSETAVEVLAMARADGALRLFKAVDCGFAYRDSIWKREERGRWVILQVTFALRPRGAPSIRYAELERHLVTQAGNGQTPDLGTVRAAVLELRRRKGMVLDPADPDTRSDGSFFVNPVVSEEALPDVLARAAALGHPADRMPRFPAPAGVKLSAGWLIEHGGFGKGYRRGRAGLSSKHALAIVNRGGATADDILGLVREIRAGIRERFGILLEPEPHLIGFAGDPLA
jgi:UDP-N-acetylmuramate dehydrogenase